MREQVDSCPDVHRGGENISSLSVENALSSHSHIHEVAVVAKKHEKVSCCTADSKRRVLSSSFGDTQREV